MAQAGSSGIEKKNWRSKISLDCPFKRTLIVAVCGDGPMVEVAVKDYRNVLTNKNNCANKALQIY